MVARASLEDDEDTEIALGDEIPMDGDAVVVEGDDGSAEIIVNPTPSPLDPGAMAHDANLAMFLGEGQLEGVSVDLMDALDEDWGSAEKYRKIVKDGMKYLGVTYEQRTNPFQDACGTYDALLMEVLVRFQSSYRGEMMPAAGPVLTKIMGQETEALAAQATRVREWYNFYLTEIAEEYYPDTDRMSMALGMWGSVFRKVYLDPRLGRPTLPFLTPEMFIVSYTTTSLESCPRSCELIPYTPREMIALQIKGFYRDVPLGEPDEDNPNSTTVTPPKHDALIGVIAELARGDDRHWVGEFHVDYDLPGFEHQIDGEPTGLPLPYIVAVDLYSRKVLSIRRNWEEGDLNFQRVQHYVHHQMIPSGEGFYGYGFIHLLGGSARASTMMLRQNVDAGTMANFPGGVRVKGVRTENSEILVGPGQFAEIETGGMRIQDAIMPMPYKGPSEITMLLRDKLRDEAKSLAANTEIAVGDGRQDAPVGTTVALLEQATKVQSAIMKRERAALRKEFRLLGRIFAQSLPEAPYPFPVKGGMESIMRTDFDNRIDIIPVADPNITNSSQRQLRAEVVMKVAMGMPGAGADQRAVATNLLREMNVENLDAMFPPPQQARPLDPVSENQMAIVGKPLKAAEYQDHASHIMVHQAVMEATGMLAHIQEHFAQKFRIDIQNAMGQALPPLGQPMPPQVENEIARMAAQAVQVMKEQQAAQQGGGGLDPVAVAMEQVKVDMAKVQQKQQADQAKISQQAQKDALNFAVKVGEMQSREKIAKLNAFVDLSDNDKPVPGGAAQVFER
jgi:hypothetical protein